MHSTNGREPARLRNRSIDTSQFEDAEANSRINCSEIESKHSMSAHCWASNSEPKVSTESKMKDVPSDTFESNDTNGGYENQVLSKQNGQRNSDRNIKISQRNARESENVCVFWDGYRQGSFADHSRHLEIESVCNSYFESSQNFSLGSNSFPGPKLDCPFPSCTLKAEAGLDGVEALISHLEDTHKGQLDSAYAPLDHTQEVPESTRLKSSKYRLLPTPVASFRDAEADDDELRSEVDMADIASHSLVEQNFYDKVTSSGLVGASAHSDTEDNTSVACEDSNHYSSSATDISFQSSDYCSDVESCTDSKILDFITEKDAKTRYFARWLLHVANHYMTTFHSLLRLDYSAHLRSCAYASEPSSSPGAVVANEAQRVAANSCQKRCRGGSEEDQDNDGSEDNPRKRPKSKPILKEDGYAQHWACFFWKHEPFKFRKEADVKYKSCPNGFPNLQRLREHCFRCHKAPIHCLRCKAEFNNSEDRDYHLYDKIQACEANHEKQFCGINEKMEKELRRATKQRVTDEEKWTLMYKVLFPGESVPSPFKEFSGKSSTFDREVRATEFVQSFVEAGGLDKLTDVQTCTTKQHLHSQLTLIGKDFAAKFGSHCERVASRLQSEASLAGNIFALPSGPDLRLTRITSLQSDGQFVGTPDLTISSSEETNPDMDSHDVLRVSMDCGYSVDRLQDLWNQNTNHEGCNHSRDCHAETMTPTDVELRAERDLGDPFSAPSTCPDYQNSSAGISYLQNDALYPSTLHDLTAFMDESCEDFMSTEPFPGTLMTEDIINSFKTIE